MAEITMDSAALLCYSDKLLQLACDAEAQNEKATAAMFFAAAAVMWEKAMKVHLAENKRLVEGAWKS